jgi:adenylate kinase
MLGYWLPDSVWGSTNGMLPQTAIITTIGGVGKTAVSPIKKHRQKRIKRGCQVFSL